MDKNYISDLRDKLQNLPPCFAKEFMFPFLEMREMVFSILLLIPEDKLDYKPNTNPKTESLRDSIADLIRIEKSLILGLAKGRRSIGSGYNAVSETPGKEELVKAFESIDNKLFEALTNPDFSPDMIIAWVDENGKEKSSLPASAMLWGMRNHENMHLGMIRRDLDAIGVQPSKAYLKYWYGN